MDDIDWSFALAQRLIQTLDVAGGTLPLQTLHGRVFHDDIQGAELLANKWGTLNRFMGGLNTFFQLSTDLDEDCVSLRSDAYELIRRGSIAPVISNLVLKEKEDASPFESTSSSSTSSSDDDLELDERFNPAHASAANMGDVIEPRILSKAEIVKEITEILIERGGSYELCSLLGGHQSLITSIRVHFGLNRALTKCLASYAHVFTISGTGSSEMVSLRTNSGSESKAVTFMPQNSQTLSQESLFAEIVGILRENGGPMLMSRVLGIRSDLIKRVHQFGHLKDFFDRYPKVFSMSGSGGLATVSLVVTNQVTKASVIQPAKSSVIPPAKSSGTSLSKKEAIVQKVVEILQRQGGSISMSAILASEKDLADQVRLVFGSLKKLLLEYPKRFRIGGIPGKNESVTLIGASKSTFVPASVLPPVARMSPESQVVKEKPQTHALPSVDLQNTEMIVVSSKTKCKAICQLLALEPLLALDCEGVDLGQPGGSLSLVQIASRSQVFLFDVLECPGLFDAGLANILANDQIVKVVHDCRMDVIALAGAGVTVQSVLDSQIAFGVTDRRSPCVGLKQLLNETTGRNHPEKDSAPHKSDPKFWSKRPISTLGLRYAAADVELLIEAVDLLVMRLSAIDGALARVQSLSRARLNDSLRISRQRPSVSGFGSIDQIGQLLDGFRGPSANNASVNDETRFDIATTDDFDSILLALPDQLVETLLDLIPDARTTLVDVVLDLERPVTFVTNSGPTVRADFCVEEYDLQQVVEACGPISDANRACIGTSLHRCSLIRDPSTNRNVGLTLRMARVVRGIANVFESELVSGKSILLVGPPGRGKTTLLRDIAWLLSSERIDRRVMVVDTNNEIAGETEVPHQAIGHARRLKVGARSLQYQKMLEAVQNHTPETLIIDEIGTTKEVSEAVGIQQRGVQLIATTHGRSLADVIQNPQLRNLLGGVNAVILSAGERMAEGAVSKTRLERKSPPAFDVCVELLAIDKWRVHQDVAQAVDVILRGMDEVVECEVRELDPKTGIVTITRESFPDSGIQVDLTGITATL